MRGSSGGIARVYQTKVLPPRLSVRRMLSPLGHCVEHVGAIISEKKMVRSNALGRVARVEDPSTLRNRPKVNFPRNSRCGYRRFSDGEFAVSLKIGTSNPEPAIPSFVNISPKPLFQGNQWPSRPARIAALPIAFLGTESSFITGVMYKHALTV